MNQHLRTVMIAVRALSESRELQKDEHLRPHYDTLANFLKGSEEISSPDEHKRRLCIAAERTLKLEKPTCQAFYQALMDLHV